jgi:hypothetical protein
LAQKPLLIKTTLEHTHNPSVSATAESIKSQSIILIIYQERKLIGCTYEVFSKSTAKPGEVVPGLGFLLLARQLGTSSLTSFQEAT